MKPRFLKIESFLPIFCIFALSAHLFCASAKEPTAELHDSLYHILQELDVVAVKSRRDLSQAPISANSIGAATIRRDGIEDLKGISGMAPNLFMPDYGSRITSSIYVRGIGSRIDQPAIGLTIDNVGILNKDAYDFEIADINNIEVIRGAQASLFGRNTMTGLINVTTLSPMQYQGWRGGFSFSSGFTFKANLGWYHKFNPHTGISVTGAFTSSEGRFRNTFNGKKIDGEKSGALRTRIHANPVEGLTISNTLAASILRQGGYPYKYIPTGEICYDDTCFYHRFLLTDGLSIHKSFGEIRLLSVTSLQHIDDNMTLDQDFRPEPYFTLTQKKRETAVTEDIMLRGKALSGKYSWLVGAYGFFRHLRMLAPVTFKEAGIENLIVTHRNKANPYYPIAWDADTFTLGSDFRMPSGGVALYHESSFDFGRWHLKAGLRLDYERTDLRYESACNTSYTIFSNPSGSLPPASDAEIYRQVPVDLLETGHLHRGYLMFLPKVSALYDIRGRASANIYASIGEGYKAGGFNTQMFSDVLQQKLMKYMGIAAQYDVDDIVGYKPERCWTFEIGSHVARLAKGLSAEVSLFYILCLDQQLTMFPPGSTTGRMMTNAGKTRSFGAEVSLNWRPIRDLLFVGNYGYTNARFITFVDGENDYKGHHLPYSPSNTLYLSGQYTLEAPSLRKNQLRFSIDCNGVGDIYWNEANTRRQPFYATLGATITFIAPKWSVELWGKNLTDTDYNTFYFLSMGNEFLQSAKPLSIGFTLRFNL